MSLIDYLYHINLKDQNQLTLFHHFYQLKHFQFLNPNYELLINKNKLYIKYIHIYKNF